jgi:hypothetical protein
MKSLAIWIIIMIIMVAATQCAAADDW